MSSRSDARLSRAFICCLLAIASLAFIAWAHQVSLTVRVVTRVLPPFVVETDG